MGPNDGVEIPNKNPKIIDSRMKKLKILLKRSPHNVIQLLEAYKKMKAQLTLSRNKEQVID